MFVIGLCVGTRERMATYAEPGIQLCAEPDTVVLAKGGQYSICEAYNSILDEAATLSQLEGVVLIHDDLEINDSGLLAQLRGLFADESIALVGATGARDITQLGWWNCDTRGGLEEEHRTIRFSTGTHDVDALDGVFLALSPRAVRELRFDAESFPRFHGYDVDYCLQARARGWRVIVTDLDLHHHTYGGYGDWRAFQRADLALRLKWGLGNPVVARLAMPYQRARRRALSLRRG